METVYSYSFLILLLPALSFVILALAGMKMSHKTAGLIGTTSLGLVTVLSYMTFPITSLGCRWATFTLIWVSCWILFR